VGVRLGGCAVVLVLAACAPATARAAHASAAARTLPLQGVSGAGCRGSVRVAQDDGGLNLDLAVPVRTVAVWLASPEEPELPPIGWGHQFGGERLDSDADCDRHESSNIYESTEQVRAACRSWYHAQEEHREAVAQLFARRWEIDAKGVVETLATSAYDALSEPAREAIRPLRPESSAPVVLGSVGSVAHAIRIPWSAFPPMRSLDLNAIALRVDVTTTTDPSVRCTTSWLAAAGPADAPFRATLSRVALAHPRHSVLTPCRYEPRQALVGHGPERAFEEPSADAVVYYVPGPSLDVRRVIVVDNQAAGYQYLPNEESFSPIASTAEFTVQPIGHGGVLCGPRLAYADAERVVRAEYVPYADVRPLVKRLSDAAILVRYGPYASYSFYGSGQCGACPRAELTIYRLDVRPPPTLSEVFGLVDVVDSGMADLDVRVSPDWRTITVLTTVTSDDENDAWTAVEHHWRGTTYVASHGVQVPPPRERALVYP
jgi:hypothetical protein